MASHDLSVAVKMLMPPLTYPPQRLFDGRPSTKTREFQVMEHVAPLQEYPLYRAHSSSWKVSFMPNFRMHMGPCTFMTFIDVHLPCGHDLMTLGRAHNAFVAVRRRGTLDASIVDQESTSTVHVVDYICLQTVMLEHCLHH